MKEARPPVLQSLVRLLFWLHWHFMHAYNTFWSHSSPRAHIPLLSPLALIFAGKKTSSIFIKLKQAFIKILNTDKDGIWSGPLPGNFPAEWPLDTCDFYGQNPEAHWTFPWDSVVVFQEPQLSESQDVTWSLGRWGLQVNFRSNTHQAPPPTNKLPLPIKTFCFCFENHWV